MIIVPPKIVIPPGQVLYSTYNFILDSELISITSRDPSLTHFNIQLQNLNLFLNTIQIQSDFMTYKPEANKKIIDDLNIDINYNSTNTKNTLDISIDRLNMNLDTLALASLLALKVRINNMCVNDIINQSYVD